MIFDCKGFDWDEGNSEKNWISHQVSKSEAEEIFFNLPLLVSDDFLHSQHEIRHYALGKSDSERLLFIAFTLRGDKLRIISARDMSRQERDIYDQKNT